MLYTKDKAEILLSRLYRMSKTKFTLITVEDIMAKATPEEIDFYYKKICKCKELWR